MRMLQILLSNIMVWLLFSSFAVAHSYSPDWSFKNPLSKVVFYNPGKCNTESDWVGEAIDDDGFYASGNLFIEYDYFLANVEKGLEFDQRGSLYFMPDEESFELPSFEEFDDELGIGYGFDGPFINYWITADSTLDATFFYSKWNIYVLDSGAASEVPLPAGAWLFGSALLTMLGWKRRSLG